MSFVYKLSTGIFLVYPFPTRGNIWWMLAEIWFPPLPPGTQREMWQMKRQIPFSMHLLSMWCGLFPGCMCPDWIELGFPVWGIRDALYKVLHLQPISTCCLTPFFSVSCPKKQKTNKTLSPSGIIHNHFLQTWKVYHVQFHRYSPDQITKIKATQSKFKVKWDKTWPCTTNPLSANVHEV